MCVVQRLLCAQRRRQTRVMARQREGGGMHHERRGRTGRMPNGESLAKAHKLPRVEIPFVAGSP
jgi:hypothetical protein